MKEHVKQQTGFGKVETHIAKAGLQSARLCASLDFLFG
jgi:hypothetical protein